MSNNVDIVLFIIITIVTKMEHSLNYTISLFFLSLLLENSGAFGCPKVATDYG